MLALQVGISIIVPDSMGLYFPTSLQLLRINTLSLHQSDLLLALDFLITPHPSPKKILPRDLHSKDITLLHSSHPKRFFSWVYPFSFTILCSYHAQPGT